MARGGRLAGRDATGAGSIPAAGQLLARSVNISSGSGCCGTNIRSYAQESYCGMN